MDPRNARMQPAAVPRLATRYAVADAVLEVDIESTGGLLRRKKAVSVTAPVIDLSVGGARIELPAAIALSAGDRLEFAHCGERGAGIVKYVVEVGASSTKLVGLSFVSLSARLEASFYEAIGRLRSGSKPEQHWYRDR